MDTVRVLTKGQIVIPSPLRKKFGIKQGSEITIFEYDGIIYLVPPSKDPIIDSMGCLPKIPSLSKSLLEEREKDFPG